MPRLHHALLVQTSAPAGFRDAFEDLRRRLDVLSALHQQEVTTLRSQNSRLRTQFLRADFGSGGGAIGSTSSRDLAGSQSESVSHFGPSVSGTPIVSAIGGDRDGVLSDSLMARSKSFTMEYDPCETADVSPCAIRTVEPSSPEALADAVVEQLEPVHTVAAAINAVDVPTPTQVLPAEEGDGPKSSRQGITGRVSSFILEPMSRIDAESERDATIIGRLVESKVFETFFGFLIILNTVTMGMQAQVFVQGQSSGFGVLEAFETLFNLLFTVELALRVKVYGFQRYVPINRDQMYNFLDALVIIVTSILCGWFLIFLTVAIPSVFDFRGRDAANVRIITLLRAVRLVRLVRVVQRVEFFKEAWILLRGLFDSVRTLFWTLVFIASITYMFAVFGMVLISKDLQRLYDDLPAESRKQAEECDAELGVAAGMAPDLCLFQLYFVSMDQVMMTLIQLLTMDDWNSMVKPMLHYKPWCWIFFYCYIAVAVFVLMNLVTAIIVDNALKSSRIDEDRELRDKEEERLAELSNISNLFHMMDTDGDGTLCWDEFKEAFDDPVIMNKWKLLDFQQEDCKELFRLLDDGDGNIDTQEFFDGLRKCKGEAQSKDVFRLQKMLERMETIWNKSTKSANLSTVISGARRPSASRFEREPSHDRSNRSIEPVSGYASHS